MVNLNDNISASSESEIGDYFELLKPKVMRLVLFTAAVGLIAAPGSVNPIIALAALICVGVGAGAAGALNMWWDSDIDQIMKRTAGRPIPSGRVSAEETLALGLGLSLFSVALLGLFANWISAILLAATIAFYIVIYTVWLKRSTAQNIVIGGAAGAFPPMIGWSIATGGIGLESILLFLLIFVWTPPHFWTLALFTNQDFLNAKVPMLTVIKGMKVTRQYIFIYSLLLAFVAVGLSFSKIGGPLYFLVACLLNTYFLYKAVKVLIRTEAVANIDKFSEERKLFLFSIFYLFAHFTLIAVEAFTRPIMVQYFSWPNLF